jgi:hypothetical protein
MTMDLENIEALPCRWDEAFYAEAMRTDLRPSRHDGRARREWICPGRRLIASVDSSLRFDRKNRSVCLTQ